MSIKSREDLLNKQAEVNEQIKSYTCRVLVCSGTGCIASGAQKIYDEMARLCEDIDGVTVEMQKDVPHVGVIKTGCQGLCELGPLMRIEPYDYQYVHVQPEDCKEIVERTVLEGKPVERLFYRDHDTVCPHPDDIPFLNQQTRIVLENCGKIDAESIEEYIAVGGYQALAKVIGSMSPQEVIDEVTRSGLRGRGGAGFPAGKKWSQVARQAEKTRYVVCNGDEGDPGAFMDGSVMEGDPYKMIEGMTIAAYAVGAENGYIYVRAEYPLSVKRLRMAIEQAEKYGLLGDNILDSGVNFHLHINRGAGAFVCGEGSALTASIEGNRGMPRVKPPRTVEKGLWGKPTVLNNVETYANVPKIILEGADWFRTIGTEGSPGTKTFSLTGSIENTGLIEVPMGTTLRHIIYDIGGGLKSGAAFKGVQIGGPSGGCLILDQLDAPLDFDSVKKLDAIMGSGFLVAFPAASGNVTTYDTLDWQHLKLTAHHTVSIKFLLLEEFRHIFYIYRNHMVRQNIFCHVKPEFGHLSQYSSFLCYLIIQDNIKATDAVCCNHDQAVTVVINLTYFTFFDWFHFLHFFAPQYSYVLLFGSHRNYCITVPPSL